MSANKKKRFPKPELPDKEKTELWNEGLFVWDTSAIGMLYSLSPKSKEKVLEIIEVLKDRFWIPARVKVEYERHRNHFLLQPISEHYKEPEFLSTHYLSKLREFVNKISSDSLYHPCYDEKFIKKLKRLNVVAESTLNTIRTITTKAIDKRKKEIEEDAKTDDIHNYISKLKSGNPSSFQEIIDIVKEGHVRYSHSIPPGYMDDEEKTSIDKFGDLFIWKEMCNLGGVLKLPMIFICNDVKEDWNAGNPDNGEMIPREELLEEYKSYSGRPIWFYTLSGFLTELKNYLFTHPEIKGDCDDLDLILKELEIAALPVNDIKVVCDKCGHFHSFASFDFNWEWDMECVDYREMGEELCYQATCIGECPECGQEEMFEFTMYQYPVNVINHVDVEAEWCTILDTPNLTTFIKVPVFESCVVCGELRSDLDDDGICTDCLARFNYLVEKDD